MDDLISRDAAIDAIVSVTAFPDAEYIKNLCQNPANSEDWLGGVCDAINAVEDVNAVEAVPVIHGQWVDVNPDVLLDPRMQCSVCGSIEHPLIRWKYCPHCGAKNGW